MLTKGDAVTALGLVNINELLLAIWAHNFDALGESCLVRALRQIRRTELDSFIVDSKVDFAFIDALLEMFTGT